MLACTLFLQPTVAKVVITLFIQYSSVICRPSDHTVVTPRAEIQTRARQSMEAGTRTTDHPTFLFLKFEFNFFLFSYNICKVPGFEPMILQPQSDVHTSNEQFSP